MKEYEASTALWNEVYSECELADLTGETLEVEPMFDTCLKIFSSESDRVLDYGCGTGDILFQCADFGFLTYGLGIDRSETGIQYANKMATYNHYRNLDYMVGDISDTAQMEDGDFDGIILSNVLDVMPKEEAREVYLEMTRLLREDGLLLVKLNPYATEHELEGIGLQKLKGNLYEEDGVLRLRELKTDTWREEFKRDFEEERYLEFPYPWQEGMNRLFLLRKKSKKTKKTE
ncbi:hypothetical protein lbkm_2107 [Lachnospiraceae bacterium KM106-2]|nr:hypothetical protein lbkm_2107 [Lachnospiraceae bacterium KM106-2]